MGRIRFNQLHIRCWSILVRNIRRYWIGCVEIQAKGWVWEEMEAQPLQVLEEVQMAETQEKKVPISVLAWDLTICKHIESLYPPEELRAQWLPRTKTCLKNYLNLLKSQVESQSKNCKIKLKLSNKSSRRHKINQPPLIIKLHLKSKQINPPKGN